LVGGCEQGAGGTDFTAAGLERTVRRYLCAVPFVIYTEAAIDAAAENHKPEEQE